MKRKIIVGVLIGIIALAAFFVIRIIFAFGGNQGWEADIIEEKRVNVCSQVSGEQVVVMKDDQYVPKDLEIKLCTRVVFKNSSSSPLWPASDIHPTHGIYPQFDPKQAVEAEGEWSFVFDRVGLWRYHDHLNPTIRGTIEVSQ